MNINSQVIIVSCLIFVLNFTVPGQASLRVMTFNTWESGANVKNGLEKIVKHIKLVNPDVIGLQEIESEEIIADILSHLGDEWSERHRLGTAKNPDDVILTRHQILPDSFFQTHTAIGCRILAPNLKFNFTFVSVHLNYVRAGRYTACNKLVTDAAQLEAGELNLGEKLPGRYQNMKNLVGNSDFKKACTNSEKEPVLVVGDFNSPSHLDWIDSMKKYHCGWSFQWPATKILTDLGFRDSFREIYPDPTKNIGITWSATHKYLDGSGNTIPEPQDRIDFIFYKGQTLTPTQSVIYNGTGKIWPQPHHKNNDWPSDHNSVISDFEIP